MRRTSSPKPLVPFVVPDWATPVALFVAALAARLLFAHAGPDRDWPYTAFYKGDALVWLQQVLAGRAGAALESDLPLRPPGMAWLIDLLWDGTPAGVATLKTVWCVIGAASVALFQLALVRPFGRTVAAIAGGAAAFSSSGLVLATSLNNEAPYLLLALLAIALVPSVNASPSRTRLLAWGAVNALACLFRVEHALFVVLVGSWWVWRAWPRIGHRAALLAGAQGLLAFVLALVPWHLEAWSRIAALNRGEHPRNPDAERAIARIEARARGVRWTPEALAAAEELPAFLRRSAKAFIAVTIAHRGGTQVRADDLEILREAYGVWPDALRPHPFVACYGALNFFLANALGASGGFDRAPLERPPPLSGGADRYASELVAAMPPARLSLEYPPHLHALNHGYAEGLRQIAADPGAWLHKCARKLTVFWRGASLGFTGYHLPQGARGSRRAVDSFTPEGRAAGAWRVTVALVVVAGLYAGWRRADWRAALAPWLLYAASKVAVAVAFFGYARQGALVQPAIWLLTAFAVATWIAPRSGARARWLGPGLLVVGLALEGLRTLAAPLAVLDGIEVRDKDPFDADEHADHALEFR